MSKSKIAFIIFLLTVIISIVGYWTRENIPSTQAEKSEPTTAVLKVVDYGPVYLRLEQEHPTVTARFLLTCFDGEIHMNAGIITTPELSEVVMGKMTKN